MVKVILICSKKITILSFFCLQYILNYTKNNSFEKLYKEAENAKKSSKIKVKPGELIKANKKYKNKDIFLLATKNNNNIVSLTIDSYQSKFAFKPQIEQYKIYKYENIIFLMSVYLEKIGLSRLGSYLSFRELKKVFKKLQKDLI